MRVGIDAVTPGAVLEDGAGGMRPMMINLVTSLSELGTGTDFVLFENPRVPLPELAGVPNLTRVTCPGVPSGRLPRVLYQNSIYPSILRRHNLDVFLATCNVLPFMAPHPAVVIVQSLQFFNHEPVFGRFRGAYLRQTVRASLRAADAVIAVSSTAREDTARLTGVPKHKIHVVQHGLFRSFATAGATTGSSTADPPYILTVSTLYRFKNTRRLIEAFALLRHRDGIPHRLRIIGGDADVTAAELRQVAGALHVLDQVDFLGAVPHAELPAQYSNAAVFVYPSLYETFGLPPLEAMAVGCPVVAANASAIPEVVGQAAELVDPMDADDIRRGIARVLLDSSRRSVLIESGRQWVKRFTWRRAAQETMDILSAVTANRSRR
jgi:glycosyltransferase involved in cell wall biosynthesis